MKRSRLITELLAVAVEPTCFDLEHRRLDPAEVVRAVRQAGANTVRVGLFSHQGHAYYPSRTAPAAPFLNGRNLLAEFSRECRRQGVRVLAYLNSKWVTDLYREHPDWIVMLRDGPYTFRDEDPHTGLMIYPMCPNSPFLEYFLRIVREVAETGMPDGIYIDNFAVIPFCRCPFCRRKFGAEIPRWEEWDRPGTQRYLAWLVSESRRLARRIVRAARSREPGLPVVFNRGQFWTVNDTFSPEDNAYYANRIADAVHGESAVRFYGESFRHINEQCSFGRSIGLAMPTWVEYADYPFGYTPVSAPEACLKAAKVLANGGRPMVWHMPGAPATAPTALAGVRQAFRLPAASPHAFNDVSFEKFVGIVCSSRSVRAHCRGSRERLAAYRQTFAGAYELAIRCHVPYDFVLDGQVTPENLRGYRLILLPDAVCLSPAQCRALDRYVRGGGNLLATHETSLYDRMGRRRADFALARLLGARYVKDLGPQSEGYCAGYAEFCRRHPVNEGLFDGLFPAAGRYLATESRDGVARLLKRCRYFCDYPQPETHWPAVIARTHGKGRVVYLPGEFFKDYHQRGFLEYKRFFERTLDWFTGGRLPVVTDLPDTVEVTLARTRSGDLVIHLVNASCDETRPIEQVAPVCGRRLALRTGRRCSRCRDIATGRSLAIQRKGGLTSVRLPDLGVYHVLVFS